MKEIFKGEGELRSMIRQKRERAPEGWDSINSLTTNNQFLYIRPWWFCRNGVVADGKSGKPAKDGDVYSQSAGREDPKVIVG